MAEETKKSLKKSTAYNIAITAMFVAIITVCAWLSLPINQIPITLQLLGVCLCGTLLGWKRGLAAVCAYILLGLIGVPVFAGFGATAKIVGPTGGYIVGFIFTVLITGIASDIFKNKKKAVYVIALIVSMIIGVAVCYAFGTAWFMIMMSAKGNSYTLGAALGVCVVPYIPFDLIKIAIAVVLTLPLKKYIK